MLQTETRCQQSVQTLEHSLLSGIQSQLIAEDTDTGNLIEQLCDIPAPYPLQSEILNHAAPRKVVASGRQVGKTFMASMSAVGGESRGGRGLIEGAHVHISSTTQDQSDLFWEYITTWLAPMVGQPGFYKNESRRIIRYKGGQIRVKTGYKPDTLRGGNVDKLILDECAYLDPMAWKQVGAPMLVARNGVAEFYSTPKRRNWFWEIFVNASDPDTTRWQAWNFPTDENPHLSKEALDGLIEDMTEEDYQQEILAQFLAGSGAVFRYIQEAATLQKIESYHGHFVAGLDWGKQKDYTVMVVFDVRLKRMVDYDRFKQVDWSIQRGRVRAMADKWNIRAIHAEQNSIGDVNIEALQKEGLPVRAFMTTAVSKPPLIESLVLGFDRRELKILDDPIIKNELMAYERTVTKTGRSQYSAPPGMHDDCVIATALGWYGIINNNRVDLPSDINFGRR
jgi:hypothetical protein